MPDWALATTPPNAEHLVARDLLRSGYDHWIFQRSVTRAHQGKIVQALLPVFPRYVFIPFEHCWQVLHDVWRIVSVVCFGEDVARVPARDVDRLIERCGGSNVLPPDAVPEPYARGERVYVGGYGLISGHYATYESLIGDGKIRVLFDMMGRVVPIDVDQRDVNVSKQVDARRRKRRRRSRGKSSHS